MKKKPLSSLDNSLGKNRLKGPLSKKNKVFRALSKDSMLPIAEESQIDQNEIPEIKAHINGETSGNDSMVSGQKIKMDIRYDKDIHEESKQEKN